MSRQHGLLELGLQIHALQLDYSDVGNLARICRDPAACLGTTMLPQALTRSSQSGSSSLSARSQSARGFLLNLFHSVATKLANGFRVRASHKVV